MPIYKVKEGQYRVEVNYKDENGDYKKIVRMNSSTATLSNAKKVERELQYKIENEIKIERKKENPFAKMTLFDLLDDYCENKASEIKISTLDTNKKRIVNYVLPFFKNEKVININIRDVQKWKSELNSSDLSFNSKKGIYGVFNSLMNYAVKYYDLPTNYVAKSGCFRENGVEIKEKIHYWTLEDFERFIQAYRLECENEPQNLVKWGRYVLYNILFYTGLRKGEAYALRWTDFIDHNKLSITKSLIYKIKDTEYIETTPKNKSSVREFSISNRLKDILEEHYQRYQRVYLFSESWFICGGLEPIKDTVIENDKNRICKLINLQPIRIHDFRHSFASMLVNGGVNIMIISKLLGHSDVKMTWNTYSHLYKDSDKVAVDYIDNLMKK